MSSIGNLGDYQRFSIAAKKVGGPKILVSLWSGAAMAIGAGIGVGAKTASDKRKQKKKLQEEQETICYTVTKSATDNQGLSLKKGDRFRVIDCNNDAILIDVANRNDNPFFVSPEFLSDISDFSI